MTMNTFTTTLLTLTVLFVLLPPETYAFGAGDIPDFAYLNGKAFRHGDIENILSELAKTAGHAAGGGGLLNFAQSVLSAATGGAKFSKEDVKKVYFGNWLRDYSQAMDIAGLSKLTGDSIVLIIGVLGFLTFGFATNEFQVTADRLGVYLPVEHIDNPKGYAEQEGDARQYHPKLRPPVNPEELEIDPNTGMKNYMATENRGWDTSTAHIRRVFEACIEHGRRARGQDGADLWEAYRLLGTGLHTLEDLLAHSNWCEIALRKLGHQDVFCHVGDDVIIDTPTGLAPPLVTGTFGSADFIHSLMGEATDHLSQASVVDLSKRMSDASNNDDGAFGNLKDIISKLPIGGGGGEDEKINRADELKAQSKAYELNPDDVAPPEVQEQLLNLLQWRDDIYRDILKKIEMVPGLEELIDGLTNALNAFVYSVLAPYLTPVLQQVTSVLSEGSKAVIDTDDQFEVFNNPNASDPSHSLLSKDHFSLILNEPAGKIAQVVVQYTVSLIVEAWYDDSDPNQVIDQILESFHHPYYATGQSGIQQQMFEELQKWIGGLGPEEAERVIQALTKESVREGKNTREGSDDDMAKSDQVYGGGLPSRTDHAHGGYGASGGQGYGAQSGYRSQGSYGFSAGGDGTSGEYGSSQTEYGSGYGRSQEPSYGRQTYESSGGAGGYASYGPGGRQASEYASNRTGGYNTGSYGPRGDNTSDTYGSGRTEGYSAGGYGSGPTPDEYESRRTEGYGESDGGHHGRRHHGEDQIRVSGYGSAGYDGGNTYGSSDDNYSSQRRDEGGYRDTSTTSSAGRYGDGEYGSDRAEYGSQSGYSGSSGYVQQERERGGYSSSAYGRDESSGYGRQERGYGGDSHGSSGYGRSDETYTHGEDRRQYGGGYDEEGSYKRRDAGYDASSGYGEARRAEYGSTESGYGQSSYGGEGYRPREGYGGGHEGRDDTFGAENLSLGSGSDEERGHGHHKKHHRKHSDDSD